MTRSSLTGWLNQHTDERTDRRTDGHINGKMQQNFVLEIMPGRWMINPEHELVIVVYVFSFIYLFFFCWQQKWPRTWIRRIVLVFFQKHNKAFYTIFHNIKNTGTNVCVYVCICTYAWVQGNQRSVDSTSML